MSTRTSDAAWPCELEAENGLPPVRRCTSAMVLARLGTDDVAHQGVGLFASMILSWAQRDSKARSHG